MLCLGIYKMHECARLILCFIRFGKDMMDGGLSMIILAAARCAAFCDAYNVNSDAAFDAAFTVAAVSLSTLISVVPFAFLLLSMLPSVNAAFVVAAVLHNDP